jgi:hypothetical protein
MEQMEQHKALANLSPSKVPSKQNRRWFQFRLRSLLLVIVIAACVATWAARHRSKHEEQQAFVEAVTRLGGHAEIEPEGPRWLNSLVGPAGRISVGIVGEPYSNQLATPDQPFGDHHVSALSRLGGAKYVVDFNLRDTGVTDAALKHLHSFSSLYSLNLTRCQITDHGVVQLQGVRTLRWLDLKGTGVTEAGLYTLKSALPDCLIFVGA